MIESASLLFIFYFSSLRRFALTSSHILTSSDDALAHVRHVLVRVHNSHFRTYLLNFRILLDTTVHDSMDVHGDQRRGQSVPLQKSTDVDKTIDNKSTSLGMTGRHAQSRKKSITTATDSTCSEGTARAGRRRGESLRPGGGYAQNGQVDFELNGSAPLPAPSHRHDNRSSDRGDEGEEEMAASMAANDQARYERKGLVHVDHPEPQQLQKAGTANIPKRSVKSCEQGVTDAKDKSETVDVSSSTRLLSEEEILEYFYLPPLDFCIPTVPIANLHFESFR